MEQESANILLIEDNQIDVVLIKNTFNKKGSRKYNFNVIDNGYRAMQFFNMMRDNASAQEPDLILLDINMPRANGLEVLHFMKSSPVLKHIPVIILTGSDNSDDLIKCYQNYCNSYLVKPTSSEGYEKMILAIEKFWFGVAKLPTKNKSVVADKV